MTKLNIRATPAARKLASYWGIDLADIPGSGKNNRIHKDDVQLYKKNHKTIISPLAKKIADRNNIDLKQLEGSGVKGKIMKHDVLQLLDSMKLKTTQDIKFKSENEGTEIPTTHDVEKIPMSPIRKVIATRMFESHLTAPVFSINYEVDMTNLLDLRQQLIGPILEKTKNKVTLTDLIGFAVVQNLMNPKHKFINSSLNLEKSEIILHKYVNIGIAVGLDNGLLVPVIKYADRMCLSKFVSASKQLIQAAKEGQLTPDQMNESTFSISNLGMFDVESFNPIINQPNSAILGVSATHQKPVVVNNEIVVRPIMKLTLVIDHRVVDGMYGARFMIDLKHTLENPIQFLI